MNYVEYKISFNKYLSDDDSGMLIAELGDLGFESFVEEDLALFAYIPDNILIKCQEDIEHYLSQKPYSIQNIEKQEIVQQNWNALWESNFSPSEINEKCWVIAPFHESKGVEYEVVIMPKMSFGTGNHETTRLMMNDIFNIGVEGKVGLDMGCGTGVLGILAAMLGAKHVDSIDIDQWAYENALENAQSNNVQDKLSIFVGDASLLKDQRYDFILANINRNILLNDMQKYYSVMNEGATISFSGFLESDIDILRQKAEEIGLKYVLNTHYEKWQMLRFMK